MFPVLSAALTGYGFFSYPYFADLHWRRDDPSRAYFEVFLQLASTYIQLNTSLLQSTLLTRTFQVLAVGTGTAFLAHLLIDQLELDKQTLRPYYKEVEVVFRWVSEGIKWLLVADIALEILFRRNFVSFALLTPFVITEITKRLSVLEPFDKAMKDVCWWITLPFYVGLPGAVVQAAIIIKDELDKIGVPFFESHLPTALKPVEQYDTFFARSYREGKELLKKVALRMIQNNGHLKTEIEKRVEDVSTLGDFQTPAQFAVLQEVEALKKGQYPHIPTKYPKRRAILERLSLNLSPEKLDELRESFLVASKMEESEELKKLRDDMRPLTYVYTGHNPDNPDADSPEKPNTPTIIGSGMTPPPARKSYKQELPVVS